MIKELEKNLRLQEIGAIKIGGKGEKRKTKSGDREWRLPEKLDHFLVTTKQRNAAGDLIVDMGFHKKIDDTEPKELSIRLLYDDIDLNFDTNYVYYHGKKCLCRGNGEFAIRRMKDSKLEEIECNRERCEFAQPDTTNGGARKCKVFGRLQCILEHTNIIGGVHIFRTTSWNTITNIVSSLKFIQSVTGGMLAGIPLKMTIQPKTVTPEHANITTTIYVVNIIFAGSPQKLLDTTIDIAKRRMVAGVQLKQIQDQAIKGVLVSHFEEDEAEVQDITEEFYPDNAEIEEAEVIESKQPKPSEIPDNGGNNKDAEKSNTNKSAKQESVDIFEDIL